MVGCLQYLVVVSSIIPTNLTAGGNHALRSEYFPDFVFFSPYNVFCDPNLTQVFAELVKGYLGVGIHSKGSNGGY